MRTEGCSEWRESLGAYALGQLAMTSAPGWRRTWRAARTAARSWSELRPVARMMPLADPERFAAAPLPPPGLGNRIATRDRGASGAASAAAATPRPGARRSDRGGGDRCAGDLRPRAAGPAPGRAAGRLRLAAARHEDRRDARATTFGTEIQHVRRRGPLRHAVPRDPARAQAAPACRPGPSATGTAPTRRPCSARLSTSRAPGRSSSTSEGASSQPRSLPAVPPETPSF